MPAKPKEKPATEALMSSAQLVGATGYSEAQIQTMKAHGIIKPVERGKWPVITTLGALVRKLREKDAGTEDRQRKNKAEADSAELDAIAKSEEGCLLADATMYVQETRIAIRQAIMREHAIPEDVRRGLLKRLEAIKIPPPKGAQE